MKRTLVVSTIAALSWGATVSFAADPAPAKDSLPAVTSVTGRQMMTTEERAEHQIKMRAAKTPEERQNLRAEQHEQMQQRAKVEGNTLPCDSVSAGSAEVPCGMNPGSVMGPDGGKGMGQPKQ